MAPDTGALKAAVRPAPAPADVRMRCSRRPEFIQYDTILPAEPPICTAGPSRPTENPAKPVSTPPIILEMSVQYGFISNKPSISPSI